MEFRLEDPEAGIRVVDRCERLQGLQRAREVLDLREGRALHEQGVRVPRRSEEHTSELQSRLHLVGRLLPATKTELWATSNSPDPAGRPMQSRAGGRGA